MIHMKCQAIFSELSSLILLPLQTNKLFAGGYTVFTLSVHYILVSELRGVHGGRVVGGSM